MNADRSSAEAKPLVSVCFVCLGNICRSPTAEGVFRKKVEEAGLGPRLLIDSAGTAAYHAGERADRRSRAFAQQRGYDLTSIARQFVAADFRRFDYVLAMDSANLAELEALKERSNAGPAHLALFRDFDATAPPGSSVPDPYYGGDIGFQDVIDQCERAANGLLQHLLEHELGR